MRNSLWNRRLVLPAGRSRLRLNISLMLNQRLILRFGARQFFTLHRLPEMRRQGAALQTIQNGLCGGMCAHGSFCSGLGGTHSGTRLVSQQLAVTGSLGIAGGDARGSLCGTAIRRAGVLVVGAGGSILSAASIAMRSQALVHLLLPGGSGLLWILERLCGKTRRFAQNLFPFRGSFMLPIARPVAGNSKCRPPDNLCTEEKKSQRTRNKPKKHLRQES